MSNDMTLNLGNLPAHLQSNEVSDEFGAGIQSGGLDAPILSIRGKEFRFRFQGNETSTRSRELKVILLRSRPHLSKRWFKDQYESGSVDMPTCFSTNGNRPDDASEEKQSDLCARCPRNQFGSKITPSGKKGKECADYKRMVILPVLDGKINDQPVVFDVPVMSLRKAKTDRSDNQFLQEYTGILARNKIPVPGVITVLEFTDAEYPQVAFRADRTTTEAEWAMIQELRASDEVTALLEEAQAEATGPITDTTPTPEPEPAKPADNGESDVANMFGGGKAKEPEPEKPTGDIPGGFKTKEPEPVPLSETPAGKAKAQETKPEPAASDSDAVMADVKKLLGGL